MTKLLDRAIAAIQRLPAYRQDEAARMLLEMVEQEASDYSLTEEQRTEVRRRLEEPPEYATDAEVEEVFRRLTKEAR
jgi:hypothetical protein